MKRYFAQLANPNTIANRLHEIPEVARFTKEEAGELIVRGLFHELEYTVEDGADDQVINHIVHVTDRIPQQVHEYCLLVAAAAELHNDRIALASLADCDRDWMRSSLVANYAAVEELMNSKETTRGRRNQTLFAMGLHDGDDFRYSDIEQIVEISFR